MKSIVCTLATLSTLATACTAVVDDGATEPQPLPEATVGSHDSTASGAPRIEPQRIQSAMRSQFFADAKGCFEALLATEPEAGGKLLLSFSILDGQADRIGVEAEGNLGDETFESCVHDSLARVAFPVVDGEVTVTYPMEFSDE